MVVSSHDTVFIICFGVFQAYEGVNAFHTRRFVSLSLNGIVILVKTHSCGTGTFTFFPATIHFVVSARSALTSFCSAVFGINACATFCHHLNAHATHKLSHAPTHTEVGVISHLLAISYFAHANPHSIAIFVGVASFQSFCIAHTLLGHTRLAHISTHVRPRLAHTVVGS